MKCYTFNKISFVYNTVRMENFPGIPDSKLRKITKQCVGISKFLVVSNYLFNKSFDPSHIIDVTNNKYINLARKRPSYLMSENGVRVH